MPVADWVERIRADSQAIQPQMEGPKKLMAQRTGNQYTVTSSRLIKEWPRVQNHRPRLAINARRTTAEARPAKSRMRGVRDMVGAIK